MIVFTIIVLIYLGNWQLHRLDWKLDLIERVESRAYSAAVDPPAKDVWQNINVNDHEYLRVIVHGKFMHDKETLVWAATELGNGYWVLTPLQRNNGEIVLINRGFVPLDKIVQKTLRNSLFYSDVEIIGLLRLSEPEGSFLRDNDPDNKRWYSRDIKAIAEAHGIRNIAPYFIDAEANGNTEQYPVGGMTRLSFRNSHLVYALTWYGLALLLAAMTINALRKSRKD